MNYDCQLSETAYARQVAKAARRKHFELLWRAASASASQFTQRQFVILPHARLTLSTVPGSDRSNPATYPIPRGFASSSRPVTPERGRSSVRRFSTDPWTSPYGVRSQSPLQNRGPSPNPTPPPSQRERSYSFFESPRATYGPGSSSSSHPWAIIRTTPTTAISCAPTAAGSYCPAITYASPPQSQGYPRAPTPSGTSVARRSSPVPLLRPLPWAASYGATERPPSRSRSVSSMRSNSRPRHQASTAVETFMENVSKLFASQNHLCPSTSIC